MLPSAPYEGVPRGRSLNAPSSALGPVIPQTGLMSAAPGGSVMGPGPPMAPATIVTASGPGQLSSSVLKNGGLPGGEEEARNY